MHIYTYIILHIMINTRSLSGFIQVCGRKKTSGDYFFDISVVCFYLINPYYSDI